MINFDELNKAMRAEFMLGEHSIHGPTHWARVEEVGRQLARENGADETVVRLFAIIHDVKRFSEGTDPEHGSRAAEFVHEINKSLFEISDEQIELLTACRLHHEGLTSENITIGTCWDADRLDLPRIGITPDREKMSTKLGKRCVVLGSHASIRR